MPQPETDGSQEESEIAGANDRAVLKDKHAASHVHFAIITFSLVFVVLFVTLIFYFAEGKLSSAISQSFSSILQGLEHEKAELERQKSGSKY